MDHLRSQKSAKPAESEVHPMAIRYKNPKHEVWQSTCETMFLDGLEMPLDLLEEYRTRIFLLGAKFRKEAERR